MSKSIQWYLTELRNRRLKNIPFKSKSDADRYLKRCEEKGQKVINSEFIDEKISVR